LIVSASRRTDIPAFFSEWFMERVRAGFCLVPNPFNSDQVGQVSLLPEDVDAIVFWTKNPAPMLRRVEALDGMGYRFYFQFTLNNYPIELEPRVPPLAERIRSFDALSKMIGASRVIWRYDPIIISSVTDHEFHRATFRMLCQALSSLTRRVVVSIVDLYRKTERRLRSLEAKGIRIEENAFESPSTDALMEDLAAIAKSFCIEIVTCAEKKDYTSIGIPPGRCIDGDLIEDLWHLHKSWKKDPGQRDECGCVVSKDIGMPDSCPHGCVYCYATKSGEVACQRYRGHDPHTTALFGNPEPKRLPAERQDLLF